MKPLKQKRLLKSNPANSVNLREITANNEHLIYLSHSEFTALLPQLKISLDEDSATELSVQLYQLTALIYEQIKNEEK